jgi:S1-C subfamily serine protease
MKNLLIISLVYFLVAWGMVAAKKYSDFVKVDARENESVVHLLMQRSTCSGFIVGKNVIATASHCISYNGQAITKGKVVYTDNVAVDFKVIKIGGTFAGNDWALLQADTGTREVLKFMIDVPHVGDIVKSIGHPNGVPYQVESIGQIVFVGQVYRMACKNYPGESGSPVLDSNNEVIGILSATYSAVPLTVITPIAPLARTFFQLGYIQ